MNENTSDNSSQSLDLQYLAGKLRWQCEHHLEEYSRRLREIGGLGVGGTELEYVPFQGVFWIKTLEQQRQHALANSILELWNEATWSYVYGHFRASIVLSAMALERALKLELTKNSKHKKSMTLKTCIDRCKSYNILPNNENDTIVRAARFVTARRNDAVHGNIEMNNAEELLTNTAPEHECVPMKDMPAEIRKCVITETGQRTFLSPEEEGRASIIYKYKQVSKSTIAEAKNVLRYLHERVRSTDRIDTESI